MKKIKDLIQSLAHRFGYHVQSRNGISGDMGLFLKSLKTPGTDHTEHPGRGRPQRRLEHDGRRDLRK
ncbi:MAG: hypothetical protein LRY55_11750, partial [Leadbetterella sp.]|nr:hypothetical protein [Leadbetterella sp.]